MTNTSIYAGLAGSRVLVTGGASGIGEALVEGFARQGAQVGFVDIDDDAGGALAARLSDAPYRPVYRRCDLTDAETIDRELPGLVDALGGVDVLVNNAGNDDRHPVEEVTADYWRGRMAVNLDHYFYVTHAVLPSLRSSSAASIINLGSVSWRLKLPNLVAYQTAKAAIEGLTRSLARDLGIDGIRVNAILPGAVETPRQARWQTAGNVEETVAAQCLAVRVQPRDVASLALFLASNDAIACTGQNFIVDAGLI